MTTNTKTRISLLCCGFTIWRDEKSGIESTGWSVYHNTDTCPSCGKVSRPLTQPRIGPDSTHSE